jgi:hypothetical protein
MMRRALFSLAVLAAFGCTEVPTDPTMTLDPQLAQGGLVHSVTGAGHTTTFDKRVFTFAANEQADGSVSGEFEILITEAGLGSENPAVTSVHARVLCLSVAGNRAWVGGVAMSSSNPAWVGNELGFAVEDGGPGGSGDLISLADIPAPPGRAQLVCDLQARVPNRSLDGGNVLVR